MPVEHAGTPPPPFRPPDLLFPKPHPLLSGSELVAVRISETQTLSLRRHLGLGVITAQPKSFREALKAVGALLGLEGCTLGGMPD